MLGSNSSPGDQESPALPNEPVGAPNLQLWRTDCICVSQQISLHNYKICFFFNLEAPYQLHVGNKQQKENIL